MHLSSSYWKIIWCSSYVSWPEFLFITCSSDPELYFFQIIPANHQEVFFCCSGNIQEVTDRHNQHNKKPHREHKF